MSDDAYPSVDTTVMILAAGHGKRMLPLTANTPKPLLEVSGVPLIEHHLKSLASVGFRSVVINHAYLGEQIVSHLGDGKRFGIEINYSDESASGALETAGGILNALPLIASDPFIVINGDIFTDFRFEQLLQPFDEKARLVLVPNPEQHPAGDFAITSSGLAALKSQDVASWTYSGIAVYKKSFFEGLAKGPQPLAPLLRQAIREQEVSAQVYQGAWHDIGTPERLRAINAEFKLRN